MVWSALTMPEAVLFSVALVCGTVVFILSRLH